MGGALSICTFLSLSFPSQVVRSSRLHICGSAGCPGGRSSHDSYFFWKKSCHATEGMAATAQRSMGTTRAFSRSCLRSFRRSGHRSVAAGGGHKFPLCGTCKSFLGAVWGGCGISGTKHCIVEACCIVFCHVLLVASILQVISKEKRFEKTSSSCNSSRVLMYFLYAYVPFIMNTLYHSSSVWMERILTPSYRR